jgi:hypothetical protein
MSLFRTRDLWQVSCGTDEEFDQGSLCVGNVTNDADGARETPPAAARAARRRARCCPGRRR